VYESGSLGTRIFMAEVIFSVLKEYLTFFKSVRWVRYSYAMSCIIQRNMSFEFKLLKEVDVVPLKQ
jgi:hypothetical protein